MYGVGFDICLLGSDLLGGVRENDFCAFAHVSKVKMLINFSKYPDVDYTVKNIRKKTDIFHNF